MSDTLDHDTDADDSQETTGDMSRYISTDQDGSTPVLTDSLPVVSDEQIQGSFWSTWRAFRDPLLISIFVIALVSDQITKQIVLNSLRVGQSWPIDGFLRFTYVRNDGTAFGMFQDNGTLLTFVSIGAVALIVYFYREAAMASWFTRVALGLQLGGALGNLLDRFRHGYVVDFFDVGPWPIFNIADSAIITGIVALVAYFTLFGGRERKSDGNSDTSEVPAVATPLFVESPASTPESRD
jgi:signal peptidase II